MAFINILWLLLSFLGIAQGFWRMRCPGSTGLARIDPIMDAGKVADHAHLVFGASNFGMNTSYSDLMASNCTSTAVYEDKSAYWTPPLMFMYANGTTVTVPNVGGMLAYYELNGDNITAFPEGFRMVAGNKNLRNFSWPVPDIEQSLWTGDELSQFSLGQKAIGYNCLWYDNPKGNEATLYRHTIPTKEYIDDNCHDGLRLELAFPDCWNGEDVDSADHKSHVAYPVNILGGGACPDGYQTRLPTLFYETIYNTPLFKGIDGQFVLSNGDPTGCGYHGDFIMGWNQSFLQSAVNTCTNGSGQIQDCPLFTIQPDNEAEQCKFDMPSELTDDNCKGPNPSGICGNVAIQSGPAPATGGKTSGTDSPSSTTSKGATMSSYHPSFATYSPGTLVVTGDGTGGLITIAQAAVTTSSSISTPTTSAEPIMTPAPSAVDQSETVIATSTYTTSGAVVEMEIVEEEVTVTASASIGSAKVRRHLDFHRHVHHGL